MECLEPKIYFLHEGLRKALVNHSEKRTLIAAICAAPMVLGRHNLLEGRRATCYPGFEEHLRGTEIINVGICEDDNLITAQGPAFASDFAFAIASRFVDSATLAQVKDGMLFH